MNSRLLDRLRGPGLYRLVLASMVVVQHFSRLHLGLWAVYTFFILSGYWIALMYRKKYRHTKRAVLTFWLSRYLRLLPVYLVCSVLALLAYRLCSPRWFDYQVLRDPAWVIRALAIVTSSSQRRVALGPAWTLDIEMQFYFLAPLLLVLLNRSRQALAVGAMVAVALLGLFMWKLESLPKYLCFFLAGVLVDYAGWRPAARTALLSAGAFAGIVAAVLLNPHWRSVLIFPYSVSSDPARRLCTFLAFVGLPFAAYIVSHPSDTLDRHLGDLAYSVYLFHPCVYILANYLSGLPSPLRVTLSRWLWLLVLPGSLAIYCLIDRPADALRRRFVEWRLRKGTAAQGYRMAESVAT
jgi:peptidoglycan/LPS O-acetylase OafA/YrhL